MQAGETNRSVGRRANFSVPFDTFTSYARVILPLPSSLLVVQISACSRSNVGLLRFVTDSISSAPLLAPSLNSSRPLAPLQPSSGAFSSSTPAHSRFSKQLLSNVSSNVDTLSVLLRKFVRRLREKHPPRGDDREKFAAEIPSRKSRELLRKMETAFRGGASTEKGNTSKANNESWVRPKKVIKRKFEERTSRPTDSEAIR